ncbi:hypothetical protein IFM46972_10731 [Aspergillus udagawae]|uniref:Antifungal protein n=1 Tax=Aspergillus udagawae TaxID=91492 RepID=A0A8H3XQC9_9EURO|nr:hypothetical protein IFM46972_10731 [Aspergillus udagawae]
MRFTVLAALAILGTALAAPTALTTSTATIPAGQPCTKNGSMGVCQSGYCLQDEKASSGVCK